VPARLCRSIGISLCLLAVGCEDDEAPHVSTIGMVDATLPELGEDAGVDAAFDGGADAGSEAGSDAVLESGASQLLARECPVFDMPAALNPLDSLVAVAVTETRLYAASSTTLFAFSLQDDCAGPRLGSFVAAPFTEVVGLAGTESDSLVVSTRAGLVRVDASGAIGAGCGTTAAQSLAYSFDQRLGLAAFGARVERFELGASGCSLVAFALAASPFAVASLDVGANGAALVATQPSPGARPELSIERGDGTAEAIDDIGRACSARATVDTQLGAAVLDPLCGRVRIIDFPGERFVYPIPAGEIGRTLVAVPGAAQTKLVLGTANGAGGPPKLRVIDAVVP